MRPTRALPPVVESERLRSLDQLHMLRGQPEDRFAHVTRMALVAPRGADVGNQSDGAGQPVVQTFSKSRTRTSMSPETSLSAGRPSRGHMASRRILR